MKKYLCLLAFVVMLTACSSEDEVIIDEASEGAVTATTLQPQGVLLHSAMLKGSIAIVGAPEIAEYGIVYATTANPTVEDSKLIHTDGTQEFGFKVQNLESNTTYYYRAYASTSADTNYGEVYSFTTQNMQVSCSPDEGHIAVRYIDTDIYDYIPVDSIHLTVHVINGVTLTYFTVNAFNPDEIPPASAAVTLAFNEIDNALPLSGVYIVYGDPNGFLPANAKSSGQVRLYGGRNVDTGFSNYFESSYAKEGVVYVENDNNGTITFTVCDVNTFSPGWGFTTKFVYHY